MIAVVDYGMGNIRSVQKGFERVGFKANIVRNADDIQSSNGVVLPGVGAFRDCLNNLKKIGLLYPIKRYIEKGRPFLGICLGFQILFTESEEFGYTKGLDIIKGRVVRFNKDGKYKGLKIPHMGWNAIKKVKNSPLLDEIPDYSYFYFVHSYYGMPEEKDVITTVTDYGFEFASSIWKGNVFACQFHPEKSQKLGLMILKKFGEISENKIL